MTLCYVIKYSFLFLLVSAGILICGKWLGERFRLKGNDSKGMYRRDYPRDDEGYRRRESGTFIRKHVDVYQTFHRRIIRQMNSTYIRDNSRHYSRFPHAAGCLRNRRLGKEMAKKWKDYGLDKVESFEYDTLLSFPRQPAKLQLINDFGSIVEEITITNEPSDKFTKKINEAIYPYFAFSPSGDIKAQVVFCEYGSSKDYDNLKMLDITLKDKIFLLKNTESESRPLLIDRAIKNGAKAILYYTDPADYIKAGGKEALQSVFNINGIIRRKMPSKINYYGDLLSIGYPSKPGYYRKKITKMKKYLYDIPVQTISSEMANTILDFIHEGNTKTNSNNGTKKSVRLVIQNGFNDSKALVVCGSLFGSHEPDRYVVIGNHRDAWIYGAADPVSGSAVMSEIVRVLGVSKKKFSYRPRRSLMVCSWDAEEQGLVGSAEWADENSKFISEKVIAYLNVDIAVEGNTIKFKALDHLAKSISDAARLVPSPENSSINLFQEIQEQINSNEQKSNLLNYDPPGITSDNVLFSHAYGIAVSDYRYTYNEMEYPKADHNGQYHTLYDNFNWMNKFLDPTFKYHLTLGKLWLAHALILLDTPIISLDLKHYVIVMQQEFIRLGEAHKDYFVKLDINLDHVKIRIQVLLNEIKKFERKIKALDMNKIGFYKLRSINDVIYRFSQIFTHKSISRVHFTKQIYLEDPRTFPGIRYTLSKDPGKNGDNVRRELAMFNWCVDMAIKSLDLKELRLGREFLKPSVV